MSNIDDGDMADDTAHGIKCMARFIGKTERQTHYLASSGQLPGAVRLGKSWMLIKSIYRAEVRSRAMASQQSAVA